LLADIYSTEFLPLDRQESLPVARQKMFFSIEHVHNCSLLDLCIGQAALCLWFSGFSSNVVLMT